MCAFSQVQQRRSGPDEWGTKGKPFAAISVGVRVSAKTADSARKPLRDMGRTCKTLQDGHPRGQHGQQLAHRQAVQAQSVSHLSRLPTSASVATRKQACGVGQVVEAGGCMYVND